jgi:hypothetical protein
LKQFLEFKTIEKRLNPWAQYWAENQPEATAHGARQPAMRSRPESRLGHGLAAQPSGENGLSGPL